jgi:tetratricopeptide (TPR) repeat protein
MNILLAFQPETFEYSEATLDRLEEFETDESGLEEAKFGNGQAASGSISSPAGPKVPSGYKPVFRKGALRGLARYGGERLDKALLDLRKQRLTSISNEDLDTLQRIANVETRGLVQGLNTWDSAVVSIGFMQWTLQHDKVQTWIKAAAPAFARYGIALDNRTYQWRDKQGKVTHQARAIAGAANKDELRWNGWADRFFRAGLDSAIIAAEVPLAVNKLREALKSLRRRLKSLPGGFELFAKHYAQSLRLRGVFQAAFNNLPAAANTGAHSAARAALKEGNISSERFLALFEAGILDAYKARKDNGSRVITETRTGARFGSTL